MTRTTKSGHAIAAHLGMDGDDFEENRYQPTRYKKPVYTIGNDYWSAGATPPKHTQGRDFLGVWKPVISDHDKTTKLWLAGEDED